MRPLHQKTAVTALTIGLALLLVPAGTVDQVWAVSLHKGKIVHYEVRDDLIKAYVSTAAAPGAQPGIVVIHEWWGLNDQIRGVADRLAESGYTAIVPDLYRGKMPTDSGLAHELMRALNEDWAIEVIEGAAAYLRSIGGAEDRPIGTIGFCMGGRLSLATALDGADIQAAVMFYGSVETNPESLKPLNVPLLGVFGDEDRGIPAADVRKFEAALDEAGKPATILIYPGVGHAFFNEERPGYSSEASEDAWQRTKKFLAEHLNRPTEQSQMPPEHEGSRPGL